MAAVVYVIGLVACVPWDQINSSRSAATNLAVGSAMSLNTRTTGFALISISNLARVTQWLILCMMIVGAAPGGAAGGVKFTTLFNLTRGIHRSIRGQAAGHTFAIAAVWAAGYGLLILTVLLILLGIHPEMPADHLLFVCVSAVGTVGLSQNPITITGGGLIVLSIAMLVGRLAPLLVLWWCAAEPEPDAVAVG
jgi:trk system potassium uptake protein TrkH